MIGTTQKTKEDIVFFGRTSFRAKKQLFGIKRKDRRQHMYVVGKTGTGKSALLHNLIVQDITNGEGLCLVDPHGELVESVLEKVPEERIKDVIYFNPADPESHIGFNVLENPDPKYKHLVASGLMGIFTKIWSNVWSARMEYILSNSVLALLDTPGTTLLGINRMLVDKEYRQIIVGNIKDPVVKAFWIHEYEEWSNQFRNEAIAPIQNKVGQFLSTAMVRNIVGQAKSTIDIFKIMNEGKILLINVSKGKIGEDNSALLGAMLITKVQLYAMERVRIPEEERLDFYLYVDEFQNFATDSFANILSEARKYRLNLIIAHQYIGQLVTDVSTKVRDAVFGNVGTMISFRVGATDAEFLEKEFEPEFMIQDLVNLPNYQIYLKLMVEGITSRPFSAFTLTPFKVRTSDDIIDKITDHSRKTYSILRDTVEKEIENWSGMGGASGKFEATCYACGNQTTLNFEPQAGRAIYCKDCLKKIKEGKLKPTLDEKDFRNRPKPKYFSNLSALGIEVEEENKGERRPTEREQENRGHWDKNRGIRDETRQKPYQQKPMHNQNKNRNDERNPQKPQSVIRQIEEKYTPARKEETEPLSLSALKPKDEETEKQASNRPPKPQGNVEELRASLREALKKNNN